jgi:folate-binding protein YgfZ
MILTGRCVLKIRGGDAKAFLQKLITRDLGTLSETQTCYGSLLTPQGRYVSDFFVSQTQDGLLLDLPTPHAETVLRQFSLYRMRMDVECSLTENVVWVHTEGEFSNDLPDTLGETLAYRGGILFRDPRLKSLGLRAILPKGQPLCNLSTLDSGDDPYRHFSMDQGISQAPQSLISGASIILEHGFLELGAVSLQKGCYPGQELIARTVYRGELRKRVFPVRIIRPRERSETEALSEDIISLPPVCFQEEPVGRLLDTLQESGLILASVSSVLASLASGELLSWGTSRLRPSVPDWMTLPEASL